MTIGPDYYLKEVRRYLEFLESEIEKVKESAEKNIGTIKQLKPYVGLKYNVRSSIEKSMRGSFDWRDPKEPRSPEQWREYLDDVYKQNEEIHKENEAIVGFNRTLLRKLHNIIIGAGIPEKELKPVPRSRTGRREWKNASWRDATAKHVPTIDSFSLIKTDYYENKRLIDEWEKKTQEEEEQRKRKEEALKCKRAADLKLVKILSDLELPLDSEPTDAMDAVLVKDKYLRLAHYMRLNRLDWSDAYNLARAGLDGFSVETGEDEDIYESVNYGIEHWDGDGRYFRDCEWNYDRIFAKVPEDIMILYNGILEIMDGYER